MKLPNAALQARLEAGARHERTLEGVALQAVVRPRTDPWRNKKQF